MSKTEILAELAHLSASDLADVQAWLDLRLASAGAGAAVEVSPGWQHGVRHVRSPRLADSARAIELVKQVLELPVNAAV